MAETVGPRKPPDHYVQQPVVVVSENGIYRQVGEDLKAGAIIAHLHFHRNRAMPTRTGIVWWDVTENTFACAVMVNGRHHATLMRKNVRALTNAVQRAYRISPEDDWKPEYLDEETTNGDS